MSITSSRFTVAVHILALLALENGPLSSKHIATSVNTNPVVIRRILSTLSKAGVVNTQLGIEGGSMLAHPAEQITLKDVYRVVEQGEIFSLHHKDPSPSCPCGSNIQPILSHVFKEAQAAMEATLAKTSIADVVADIKARL